MAIDGEPVPGTFAAEDELFGIGRVLGELGTRRVRARAGGRARRRPRRARARDGVDAQAVGRDRPAGDVRAHAERPRPRVVVAHARAVRGGRAPRARRCGRRSRAGRSRLLLGLQTFHPFAYCPSWAPIGGAPLAEKVARDARPRAARAGCSPRSTPRSSRCCSSSTPSARSRSARARLRARPRARASPASRARREPRADGRLLRRADGGRRPRARDAPAAQLHRLLPRRGARDAPAPDERVGPRRRRRALRHDVRREHADVHAHALGARPSTTTGCRSSGSCAR